jgi:cobalt-zinc-cadmium efflux system protein
MRLVPGVAGIHHVHLWMMQEHGSALDAHVVTAPGTDHSDLRKALKSKLKDSFNLHHMTLELETEADQCKHPATIGH